MERETVPLPMPELNVWQADEQGKITLKGNP